MVTYKEFIYSDYFKTELPTHWQEKRLGFLAIQTRNAFVDGPFGSDLKSDDYLDEGVPLIQLNNIRDGKHILRNMKFISDAKKKSLIRHLALPQDIVIAKMAEPVARAAVVSGEYAEYVIVADCVKLTPNLKLVDLDFLIWAINSDCVRENAELVSTGTTRIRINLGELKKLKVPYPSLSEQIQIRTFLDHETAKIDSLIEKQQQLIRLLKEKRQAVISQAVTKGLNPDVPMKDSGVEWLGQVPEHWDMAPVRRYLLEHRQGYYTTESYVDEGLKLLRITDLCDLGEINVANCPMVNESDTTHLFKLKKGDVVFARTGGAGSFGVITEKYTNLIYASYLIRFRFMSKIFEPDYLRFLFQSDSFQLSVKQNIHGGVNQNIHAEDIKNTVVCAPSLLEQKKIVEYLEYQCSLFENLINKAIDSVKLMQERRTALISSAVTGKVDVRNWQNPNNNNEAKTEFSA